MNYRHAYHAGNFADAHKHVVLLALLEALQLKATPFAYIDTHAGSGRYALDSVEANKTGEHRSGITRLLFPDLGTLPARNNQPLPPLLRRWLDRILALPGNENGVTFYPGSPLLAASAMRETDAAYLCELQVEEALQLRELFRHDARIHVHQRDGYEALKALLPPKEKRGLVLIDPPYEAQDDEYPIIERSLKAALERWPSGILAVWYPIKLRSQVQPFLRRLGQSAAKRVLLSELLIHADDSPLRLNGSGLVVLNAPWQLDESLREAIQVLAQRLGQDAPARARLEWLRRD